MNCSAIGSMVASLSIASPKCWRSVCEPHAGNSPSDRSARQVLAQRDLVGREARPGLVQLGAFAGADQAAAVSGIDAGPEPLDHPRAAGLGAFVVGTAQFGCGAEVFALGRQRQVQQAQAARARGDLRQDVAQLPQQR